MAFTKYMSGFHSLVVSYANGIHCCVSWHDGGPTEGHSRTTRTITALSYGDVQDDSSPIMPREASLTVSGCVFAKSGVCAFKQSRNKGTDMCWAGFARSKDCEWITMPRKGRYSTLEWVIMSLK